MAVPAYHNERFSAHLTYNMPVSLIFETSQGPSQRIKPISQVSESPFEANMKGSERWVVSAVHVRKRVSPPETGLAPRMSPRTSLPLPNYFDTASCQLDSHFYTHICFGTLIQPVGSTKQVFGSSLRWYDAQRTVYCVIMDPHQHQSTGMKRR